jgi:hypothetical protein
VLRKWRERKLKKGLKIWLNELSLAGVPHKIHSDSKRSWVELPAEAHVAIVLDGRKWRIGFYGKQPVLDRYNAEECVDHVDRYLRNTGFFGRQT